MYRGYPCRFDALIAVAESTDITNAAATTTAVTTVETMLANEARQETDGEGDYAPDLAYLRINGSICKLEDLLERAVESHAPEAFVTMLRRVLAEARKAYDAATQTRGPAGPNGSANGAPPAPAQAWTKGPPMNYGPDIKSSDLD